MSAREWLNHELEDESQTGASSDVAEEPWLDAAISAVAAEVDLSDRTIDLLIEIAERTDAARATLPEALSPDPAIRSRRESLGMSTDDAARQIGVSAAGYEGLERFPLRWLNVADTGKVAAYLVHLGVSRGVFVRWLASLRPVEAGFAWGYRPGVALDKPVVAADDYQEHFLAWGSQLLHEEA